MSGLQKYVIVNSLLIILSTSKALCFGGVLWGGDLHTTDKRSFFFFFFKRPFLKSHPRGFPDGLVAKTPWSQVQGTQVQSVVRKPDPTWWTKGPHAVTQEPHVTTNAQHSQIRKQRLHINIKEAGAPQPNLGRHGGSGTQSRPESVLPSILRRKHEQPQ